MSKYSVKKPFTVLVCVIIVIALGVVSVTRLTTDLLPPISIPYMMVITTYPGASPEKVESQVSEPLEAALGTVTGVKNVYSVNAENYSMIELEFTDGTNMDSAALDISGKIQQLTLPDGTGTPMMMELSMDMMATMYVAVNRDGYDIYELSNFAKNDIIPALERVDGVASVSTLGLVEKTVQVELSQEKIDAVNERILRNVNEELDKAAQQLEDAQKAVDEGEALLAEQEAAFGSTLSKGVFDGINAQVSSVLPKLRSEVRNLSSQVSSLIGRLSGAAAAAKDLSEAAQEAKNAASDAGDAVRDAIEEAESRAEEIIDEMEQGGEDSGKEPAEDESGSDSGEGSEEGGPGEGDDSGSGSEGKESGSGGDGGSSSGGSDTPSPDTGRMEELYKAIRALEEVLTDLSSALSETGSTSWTSLLSAAAKAEAAMAKLSSVIADLTASGEISGGDAAKISEAMASLESVIDGVPSLLGTLQELFGTLSQAQLSAAVAFSQAASQLTDANAQLETARTQYNSARESALSNANLDALLTKSTLAGLIYAQNFAMPAGYIDDKNDNAWLLKVGEEYSGQTDLAEALLADIDGIGTIRLSDVADITIIDNAGESYTRLNGEEAVLLCVYKSSTAGTNEVSRAARAALETLEEDYDGTKTVVLVDQGTYITLIVNSILKSMVLGALLAVLILAVFLRDIRPTFVVAISIPLSVLFTIVLMYFSNLTLNMMTLSGLALGVGMLVDNSIVVMENIFRLRTRGLAAPHAAVQGAKQVVGAITSSTLTTICVFLPMIFTTGTVRQLLVPMALSITYCLVASLIVALTVVPASASTILRRVKPKKSKFYTKVQDLYEKSLAFCLDKKIVPLAITIGLLAVAVVRVATTGISMFPDMTSNNIEVDITTDEDLDAETSYAQVDAIVEAILTVDGIENIGIMDSASTAGLLMAGLSDVRGGSYGSYIGYVSTPEGISDTEIKRISADIEEAVKDLPGTVNISTSAMGDMASYMSSGMQVNVYGNDTETLREISGQVMEILRSVDGFENISDGIVEGEQVLHLHIDKDKAMGYGLTVAGVYAEIAQRLATQVKATTVTVDGVDMDVVILDETNLLTKENLMDMEFTSASSLSASSGMSPGDGSDLSDTHKLSEFATLEETVGLSSINRLNQTRYITVSATTKSGYNTTLLTRKIRDQIEDLNRTVPSGYSVEIGGESAQISEMLTQMMELMALALLFVYLVMVAQFQSLLSPFIILFTVPLAFTGGMLGLIFAGQQLTMLSLMGFLILMGTVVNNGIVFVDYTNQLRIGGLSRRDALIATGKTRMRPILMTALTTILAMGQLIFGKDMGSQLGSGMAIVIAAGLIYATLMTLYIIPVMYDIFFKKPPLNVDTGSDLDEAPDDAEEYLAAKG